MRKMNKGQAAMEYLMTYGWAILIIIIVVLALWRMGIFNNLPYKKQWLACEKLKDRLSGTNSEITFSDHCRIYFCDRFYTIDNYTFRDIDCAFKDYVIE